MSVDDPDGVACQCPIHGYFADKPSTLPLGVPFADRVSIRSIPFDVAGEIYRSHHSYLPTERTSGAPVHHGIYLDDSLVGAVTYAYMLCSDPIAGVEPEHVAEVARVCIGVDMPNLASCSMAKSQQKFADEYATENDIRLLTTYVKEGYTGAMFDSLRGLGWRPDGESTPSSAGNRPDTAIRAETKTRWVCPLENTEDGGVDR